MDKKELKIEYTVDDKGKMTWTINRKNLTPIEAVAVMEIITLSVKNELLKEVTNEKR